MADLLRAHAPDYQSIALDINWIDPVTCTPTYACLGVTRFKSLDPAKANDPGVIRGTAVEVAKWVLHKLKEFHLVPREQLSVAITQFVRAACTDNASPEVKAVVDELRVLHEPCVCHSLDLVVGFAVQPSISKAARDAHAEACASAERSGDVAPPPLETAVNRIVMQLAEMAKFNKKGKGAATFCAEQTRRGVACARSLISRARTRWSNTITMLMRAILLRQFMAQMCALAGKDDFSSMDWAIMIQCVALLQPFSVAIASLQSRTMLIGEHVGTVLTLIEEIMQPDAKIKMMPHDTTPTVEELNTRGFSLHSLATIAARAANVVPEAAAMLGRMQQNLKWRLGDEAGGRNPKFQLNSEATMQAVAFDPALKYLVLNDLTTGNLMFSMARKVGLNSTLLSKGKAMAAEMAGITVSDEPASNEEDQPVAKQAKLDPRVALMQARLQSQSAAAGTRGAERDEPPTVKAFIREFTRWKEYPLTATSMSEFWSSPVAVKEFPILRRMFLSICSTRPDNAELERHFSALMSLLAPQRRGKMKWQTIERKMFLVLNKQHWRPLKDVPDDDPYYHELCVAAGLRHDKPKEGEPAASAPPPPLATPLDATAYLDSDDDDE